MIPIRTDISIMLALCGLLLCACRTEAPVSVAPGISGEVIRVGGMSVGEVSATATKADEPIDESTVQRTDAENISWLVGPLKTGLDITYGSVKNEEHLNSRVAILKLLTTEQGDIKYSEDPLTHAKVAEYSFLYRDNTTGDPTDVPAIWYDNGAHFFEGVHVPGSIGQTTDTPSIEDLSTDQHSDAETGNYTLLERYLAMPAGFTLNATVGRIKLPFHHRLSRVLAYILIDPSIGSDVQIAGYMQDGTSESPVENPASTSIRFCNVDVLTGVKDSYDEYTKHHTYTPQWKKVRKAIPHFVGERGSYDDSKNLSYNDDHFIAYFNTEKHTYVYPTDAEWASVYAHNNDFVDDLYGIYERTAYGTVPVYDLIVRPTYLTQDAVMFDEDFTSNTRKQLADRTNQIEFEITLNNGLQYSKTFVFDLDANYETVVYLHINREKVDYNSSGSVLWQETTGYDGYYGVNNANGNNLSFAGSSWQRAYTNKNQNYGVTDGHLYLQDGEDKYAQYIDDATWIELFREAREGGLNHGDYFVLDRNISIPAAALPEGFVFTGHLDGQDHTITLTGDAYTPVQTRAYYEFVAYTGAGDKYIRLPDGSYQKYTGEDGNLTFYSRVLHEAVMGDPIPGKTPSSLFAGLNGKYTTAQETNPSATPWEANVHWERGRWVPYKTETDGWRAEIINTNLSAGTVFPAEAVYGTTVTGYVHNCWEGSSYNGTTHKWTGGTKVQEYTPSLPEY